MEYLTLPDEKRVFLGEVVWGKLLLNLVEVTLKIEIMDEIIKIQNCNDIIIPMMLLHKICFSLSVHYRLHITSR